MTFAEPGATDDAAPGRTLATSFELQAAEYARLRPGYPVASIDTALPAQAARVLDVGAGTGKLTSSLLDRGLEVISVEPLWGMVAELHRLFPGAHAVGGRAEDIPIADSTVDAVLAGQAFHWFDPAQALDEIARVLRPGGVLALLWNHDDEADPLVSEIESALGRAGRPPGGVTGRAASDGDPEKSTATNGTARKGTATKGTATKGTAAAQDSSDPPFQGHPRLEDPRLTRIAWTREQSVDDLIGLLGTYSYVIRADDRTRADLATQVRTIIARHHPGAATVSVPVICEVWVSTCR